MCADVATARPWLCLPPVFDGGQRLHPRPAPSIFWLELLLRQHELCWREPATPGELRVALVGNSVAYGMPLPVEEAFSTRLNQHFAARGIPAWLYNLGFVYPYQVRDALVIHEALRFEPDVLVYTVSLDEFVHLAPHPFEFFRRFFDTNRQIMDEMIADPPPGLVEPFEMYREYFARQGTGSSFTAPLGEIGAWLRIAARANAEYFTALVHSSHPSPPPVPPLMGKTKWDCADTVASNKVLFQDWKLWNILAYLEHIHRTRGVEVIVVDWPMAYEPVGECYNVRYSAAVLEDYLPWVEAQAQARGLHYLDLHDSLPPGAFLDSQHLNVEGHRLLAEEIARKLDPILAELARRQP